LVVDAPGFDAVPNATEEANAGTDEIHPEHEHEYCRDLPITRLGKQPRDPEGHDSDD
jgi:hypothetical protein